MENIIVCVLDGITTEIDIDNITDQKAFNIGVSYTLKAFENEFNQYISLINQTCSYIKIIDINTIDITKKTIIGKS